MSKSDHKPVKEEFTGWKAIFWPVHSHELKKFLPMSLMMFCFLFVYTVLRDTKDALVILAPGGGAETLGFIKLYGVTPCAILFMIIYAAMLNMMSKEKVFNTIIIAFLVFFMVFAFVIQPNQASLHMSLETIEHLQKTYPTFHWLMPVLGSWSYSLFYILSELWGSVVLTTLFWQFANQVTRVKEAKRFYGLFGLIANVGTFLAGAVVYSGAEIRSFYPAEEKLYAWSLTLKILMTAVLIGGMTALWLYKWIHTNVLTDPTLYDPTEIKPKKSKPKLSLGESFKYLLSSRYLALIAMLLIGYGMSISMIEGVWKGQVKIRFATEAEYAAFTGQFSMSTGAATIILMIIGNNLLRRFSWKIVALVTPLVIAVTSALFFIFVAYGNLYSPFDALFGTTVVMMAVIIGWLQNVLSKGTKYSLFDATMQMSYIPLDEELKTKGQAAVGIIGGRLGKSSGAFVLTTTLMLIGGSVKYSQLLHIFAPIVMIIIALWIMAVLGLNRKFLALCEQREREKLEKKEE